MPAEVVKGLESGSLTIVKAEQFSGPLPHPEVMKGYEQCLPGAAERILAMTEKQVEHRVSIEAKVIDSHIHQAKWGMYIGAFVCLAAIVAGSITAVLGQTQAGAAIAVGPTVALSSVFIWGQFQRRREREEKARQMAQPARR